MTFLCSIEINYDIFDINIKIYVSLDGLILQQYSKTTSLIYLIKI